MKFFLFNVFILIQFYCLVQILFSILENRIFGSKLEPVRNLFFYGTINKIKNRDILRCIANYNAGTYKAVLKYETRIKIHVLEFIDESNNTVMMVNVDDYNTAEFGKVYLSTSKLIQVYDNRECAYTGNISVYTKNELMRIKHELSNEPNPLKTVSVKKEVIIQ